MAIGDIKASGGLQTQLIQDRSSDIRSRAVSGLGDAVNRLATAGFSYLNSRTDIEKVYDDRAMKSKGLELNTQFLQYQQDRAKEYTEFSRGRSANPVGMTEEYDAMLAEKEKEFLATVDPRFREEAAAKLAQDRAMRVGSAFTSELSLMDTADTNNLNTGLNQLGSGLKGKSVTLEDAQAEWEEMVLTSGLPAEDKQQFIEKGKATLQGLEFGTIVEEGAKGYGAVNDGSDGSDVSAAGLTPQDRGVLNVIAANESPGYNVWNGGSTFTGYEDHPAATSKAPGESTAAGRYQFILGTWRAASASYEKAYGVKVPNFSPEWQDRVALHWAENQFNRHYSGFTFREALASGDPQKILKIRDVLGKPRSSNPNDLEWKGVGLMSDADFLGYITGEKGLAGGGTGPADMPDVWTDPRFQNVGLDDKLGFANAAKAAAENFKTEQANQFRLEREKFLDSAYNAGYLNEPGVIDALKQSQYWDAEAQAKYNAGQEVFRKSESGVASVNESLASGKPLAANQMSDFGKWFGAESFAGISNGDQNAYDKMRYAVNSAKLFPEGSVDAFRAALGNQETAQGALAFLAAAHGGDSSMLRRSGFTQADIASVQLFKQLAERRGSLDAAFEDYKIATNREAMTGKTQDQLATEASKLFTTSFPSADAIIEQFEDWSFRSPDIKLNPTAESQLMLDAGSAFQDGYALYGSEDAATAYMESYLDKVWGVTQTRLAPGIFSWGQEGTRGVLMRHPPENHYVGLDGDLGPLYNEIGNYAEQGGASRYGAVLIPDEQTDKEVREGKLPTYKVLGQDEFGGAMVLEGRFGGDPVQEIMTEDIGNEASRRNAVEPITRLQQPLIEIESKLSYAETFGGTPEEIEALRSEKAVIEQKMAAETLAAVENGYLDPTAIVDTEAMAAAVGERLANDPAMGQRVERLALQYKDQPQTEAKRLALASVIEKDFKVTPQVAMSLVDQYLETEE